MNFQNFVISRLTALTSAINAMVSNAKKIEEFPHQSVLNANSKIHVSINGVSQHLTIAQILAQSNSSPIAPMELRVIARGPTNNSGNDLAGDIVKGWGTFDSATNTGVYWKEAIYLGGNRSDRANYNPTDTIDINFTELGITI